MASKRTKNSVNKRRILLVEDHPIVAVGLKEMIRGNKGLEISGQATGLTDVLSQLKTCWPDLLILDFDLKSGDGFEIIRSLVEKCPNLPILVISGHDEELFANKILRAGAMGYIMKRSTTDELLKAIRAVLDDEIYLSTDLMKKFLKSHFAPRSQESIKAELSLRELEVFQLIGQGLTMKQMAAKLHLSIKTVETHRDHIRQKLDLEDAAAVRRLACNVKNNHRIRHRFGSRA